jgi:hypothetical protein
VTYAVQGFGLIIRWSVMIPGKAPEEKEISAELFRTFLFYPESDELVSRLEKIKKADTRSAM